MNTPADMPNARRYFWLAIQLAGWPLLAVFMSRLLAVQAEEITLVDGVEKRVVYNQSISPQIWVAVSMTAMLVYAIVWLIFPRWFDRGKPQIGVWVTLLTLGGLLLLEYVIFEFLCRAPGEPAVQKVFENGTLIQEGAIGSDGLQESVWAFWNLGLFLLGAAVAFAWSFGGAWQRQQRAWQNSPPPATPENTLVALKSGTEIHQLALEEILFLKKEGNYFEVVTRKKKIIIRQNMETALQWLPAEKFQRVHRSYIVALPQVQVFKNNTLLVGEHEVPVGAGYRDALLNVFRPG